MIIDSKALLFQNYFANSVNSGNDPSFKFEWLDVQQETITNETINDMTVQRD